MVLAVSLRLLEVCQGEATASRLASDRLGSCLGKKGSHRRLKGPGWPNYSFAFHDNEEVRPGLLPQIAKKTGLEPGDL